MKKFSKIGVGLFIACLALLHLACPGKGGSPTSPGSNPTATPTPVPVTPSSTPTATSTNTLAATPSSTPTGTASRTATSTATLSPTGTASLTSTSTPSSTATATASGTPSNTPTPTSSGTPTDTPTTTSTPYYVFSYALGSNGTLPGQFQYADGIAVSLSGSTTLLYVVDSGNNRVQFYNSSTSSWTTYGGTATGTAAGQFNNPLQLINDPNGDLFVSEIGNQRVQEYVPGTGWSIISTATNPGNFNEPIGVAVNTAGDAFVTDTAGTNWVQEYVPGSGWNLVPGYPGRSAYGCAEDGSGNLYVVDISGHAIYKYNGSSWSVFASGNGPGPGQFSQAYAVAADNQGNVFVSDIVTNHVQKFDSSGNYLTVFGTGQLAAPEGIAVDNLGNVYVGDADNNRIAVYSYVP